MGGGSPLPLPRHFLAHVPRRQPPHRRLVRRCRCVACGGPPLPGDTDRPSLCLPPIVSRHSLHVVGGHLGSRVKRELRLLQRQQVPLPSPCPQSAVAPLFATQAWTPREEKGAPPDQPPTTSQTTPATPSAEVRRPRCSDRLSPAARSAPSRRPRMPTPFASPTPRRC